MASVGASVFFKMSQWDCFQGILDDFKKTKKTVMYFTAWSCEKTKHFINFLIS